MSGTFPKTYKGRKVLVTGHTGFKGAWLSLWLNKMGAEVYGVALDPHTTPNLYEACGLHGKLAGDARCDIRDADELMEHVADIEPDVVFHLAAQPIVRAAYREAQATFATNVMGTVNVCEAVRTVPSIRAFVHVSTDKCYEPAQRSGGYCETDPLGGPDPYSASKAAAELCFSAYCRSFYQVEGRVLAASGRAGNVIGGGDWAEDRLVPDIARALKDDAAVGIRNPNAVRPWQHVLDALAGYLTLGAGLIEGRVEVAGAWNFGPLSESFKCVRELAETFLSAWGAPADAWQTLKEQNAPAEAEVLVLNSMRARKELGWRSVWAFEEVTEHTANWYQAFYAGEDANALCLADIQAYESARENGVQHGR
jgi:CDP-glucose 4,6-dehydratase